jgi:hypothetical protein
VLDGLVENLKNEVKAAAETPKLNQDVEVCAEEP